MARRRFAGLMVPMVTAAALLSVDVIANTAPAGAAACEAPEANVPPPPGTPTSTPTTGQLPFGPRPRGALDDAPLPKLGPLISALLHPNNGAQQTQPNAQTSPSQDVAPEATPSGEAPDPDEAIGGSSTSLVNWVTGTNSPNRTLEQFGVSGTDLGLSWDNGDPANRQVLMAFGDTFGYCRVHGRQWRYNILMRSHDRNLADGLDIGPGAMGNRYSGAPMRQPNFARQIIPVHQLAPVQASMIPTAGVGVGGKQYLNFMSVKKWGNDGDWSTNYSAIAMSSDNGETWGIFPGTVRSTAPENVPGARYVPGNERFQQGAFLRGGDGYVYSFGTPAGRGGAVYLARVPENQIPDLTKYQYWNFSDGNGSWVPVNPGAATVVVPGPVGEMSVQYNTYLQRYLMLYGDAGNNVVARTAPSLPGPWSAPQTLVSSAQMPGGIYAPYLHPWANGKDLYFTLSLWSAYDVMLMRTVLG